jgi:hypothetical protein
VFDEAARVADYAKHLVDFVVERPAGSELLFVDDGSSDGTPELLETSSPVSPRCRPGCSASRTRAREAPSPPDCGPSARRWWDSATSTCHPARRLRAHRGVTVRAGGLAIGSRDLTTSTLV